MVKIGAELPKLSEK